LWAFSKHVMVQILWGRAGLFRLPVIPSPRGGGAWSGAVATHGVNQEGDHADKGVRQKSDRARVASGVFTLPWHGPARGCGRRAARSRPV
jgi:hypothetical protein